MIVIRTAEDMARALDSPLDAEAKDLLRVHRDRLSQWREFDLSDLAVFIIAQPGDTLGELEQAFGERLVADEKFAWLPELTARHNGWIEVVFILSDDGFGLVLLVSSAAGSNPELLTACDRHLSQCS